MGRGSKGNLKHGEETTMSNGAEIDAADRLKAARYTSGWQRLSTYDAEGNLLSYEEFPGMSADGAQPVREEGPEPESDPPIIR